MGYQDRVPSDLQHRQIGSDIHRMRLLFQLGLIQLPTLVLARFPTPISTQDKGQRTYRTMLRSIGWDVGR